MFWFPRYLTCLNLLEVKTRRAPPPPPWASISVPSLLSRFSGSPHFWGGGKIRCDITQTHTRGDTIPDESRFTIPVFWGNLATRIGGSIPEESRFTIPIFGELCHLQHAPRKESGW